MLYPPGLQWPGFFVPTTKMNEDETDCPIGTHKNNFCRAGRLHRPKQKMIIAERGNIKHAL
jgi:hypothetical protein